MSWSPAMADQDILFEKESGMSDVVLKPTKTVKRQGKKGKPKDGRPARKRYWAGKHLEKTKIQHMMKAYGLNELQAKKRWHAERKTRVPAGYVSDYSEGRANTHKAA